MPPAGALRAPGWRKPQGLARPWSPSSGLVASNRKERGLTRLRPVRLFGGRDDGDGMGQPGP